MFTSLSLRVLVILIAAIMTVIYVRLVIRIALKRSPTKRAALIAMFPIALAIMASMFAIAGILAQKFTPNRPPILISSVSPDLRKVSQDVGFLMSEIKSLQEKIYALSLSSEPNTLHQETVIAQIQTTLIKHDNALKKLEGLVISEPEKLITLPLMQRDFQNIQSDISTVKERVNDLASMITETAGQNRWVIGTLAFGILALVLPVIKSMFTTGVKGTGGNE